MDDFYKNIKDNLENRPEPPFNERAWQDMEKRLNTKPGNSIKAFGLFWFLPLVLGSLLLSNIFFYKKLNDANEKISHLEFRTDTIHQTHIIYQYDTIYRNSVKTEYVVISKQLPSNFYTSQASYFNHPSAYSNRSNWINTSLAPLTFAELKYLFEDEQVNETPFLAENNLLTQENGESPYASQSIALQVTPYLKTQRAPLIYESAPVVFSYLDPPADNKKVRKRPLQKLARDLQPTGFEIGMLGGFAFPQHHQVAETKGYSVGIYGAMSFSDNIRMWAETSYYKIEFKSNEIGKSLGIPEIELPDDDYKFHEASVHQPFLQYVLGLQYVFYPKNKWKPYFGLGYTVASMKPYEVSYDFNHVTDDLELSIEENIHRNDLIMNMALFKGGIEGKLANRIGLKLEGYYRWNGNKKGLVVTNIYGIRSLLIYKF